MSAARADDGPRACNELVDAALQRTGNVCLGVGRNEVCYGHGRVSASLTSDSLLFAAPGDIVPVTAVDTLVTYPFNAQTQEWGVAVMDIQADLPVDSDHSMRLVLMGGVNLVPDTQYRLAADHFSCSGANGLAQTVNIHAGPGLEYTTVGVLERQERLEFTGRNATGNWLYSAHGWVEEPLADINCVSQLPVIGANKVVPRAPMQSFVVQINEEAHCQTAPSGLLIQTPSGMVGNVRINDVDVRIGSTAFVRMVDGGTGLAVSNLEGEVIVQSGDHLQAVPVGSETQITLSQTGQAAGIPSPPQPLQERGLRLPPPVVDLLPERTIGFSDEGVPESSPGAAISEDARDHLPGAAPGSRRPGSPGNDGVAEDEGPGRGQDENDAAGNRNDRGRGNQGNHGKGHPGDDDDGDDGNGDDEEVDDVDDVDDDEAEDSSDD